MFKNIYYDKVKSEIHLWYEKNNEKLYKKEQWVPFLYVPSDKKTNINTIYGNNVIKKKFNNFNKYNTFSKNNSNIFENNVKPEIQYLAENYYNINDDEIKVPNLKIFSLDIEVHSESGEFPTPDKAAHPIPLISLYEFDSNKIYSFGLKDYNTKETDKDVIYYQFDTEVELLTGFIDFFHKNPPDVLTGWHIIGNKKLNMSGFDLKYIINRVQNIFNDEEYYHKLSPINYVFTKYLSEDDFHVDILGITIIDYMAAYKIYSRNNPESYKLDFICNLELGKGKLEYEYDNLRQLYQNDWKTYVDYNIIDTKRIKELEDKLSYIKLIQNLSLITRCQMKYYQSVATLLEARMLVYYRRNNLCAPKMIDHDREQYPAAYIKEPHKGLHHWLFSIDIASSYPTAIVTLNMSIETYIGKILNMSEKEIILYTSKREYPEFEITNFYTNSNKIIKDKKLKLFNKALKKGYIAISPSGACFNTKKEGVIAHEERTMFEMRKKFKQKMQECNDKIEKAKYFTIQNSFKALINSFYGILAFPYRNRYMNVHIAEAITACGRHSISQGEKFGNEILNNPNKNLKEILNKVKSL